MGYRYIVLGAGRQGTAAAYDLARHGEAESLLLADADKKRAEEASLRISSLLKKQKISKPLLLRTAALEVENPGALVRLLKSHGAVLSAVPYYLNPKIAEAAIQARTNYCDLGGYFETTQKIHKLHSKAKKAGVSLIPDCGLAPGMINTLAVCGIGVLDICREVKIYCGGLPQQPRPPLGYKAVFNLEGLLGNYFGKAYVLRKGKVAQIPTFTEYEEVELPEPLGRCEAFVTGGATSTAPWSFQNRLQTYEYKTVRYPGHYEKIKTLKELGLLDDQPVSLNGSRVVPRKLFIQLAQQKLAFPEDKDLVVFRVICRGSKEGKPTEVVYEGVDFHDDSTGFSAMERTTGFSAAVVLYLLAKGAVRPKGVVPLEKAVPGRTFLEEIRKRQIKIIETIRDTYAKAERHGPIPENVAREEEK